MKIIPAVPAVVAAVALGAPAHADTDPTTQAVCTASRLGESDSQIVDQLHQGDGRWNGLPARNKVDETVISGGCG